MFLKRMFFGWWVLLGIFIAYTALCGIQIYTLPLFYLVDGECNTGSYGVLPHRRHPDSVHQLIL
jgi:hypothetical protein